MNLFGKQSNERLINLYRISLIILLATVITYIVFMTGGTKGAWTQLYFIIIVLAAYYWKVKGSLLVALALGIMTGPFMPLDTSRGTMQTPENWIVRMLIYIVIGAFAGYILQKNEEINNRMRDKDLINEFTGLYNTNKLFPELNKMLKNDEKFYLVFFDIKNLNEINKYVSYSVVKDIMHYFISSIKSEYEGNDLYSGNFNEFTLVLKDYNKHEISQTIFNNLKNTLNSIKIDGYSFYLIIKVGIAFSNGAELEAMELYRRARIAASQGGNFESGVYTFDPAFNEERKLFHEISGSLQAAINNNEFYLVYQPIISLNENEISSVEVLARWNRGERKPIGPGIFIKIAEETGLIQKITKEIIKQHIYHLLNWEKVDIRIKTSVNITANELIDDSFVEWLKEIIDEKDIDSSNLEIEITERILSRDGNKLNGILSNLQSQGYCISIDDFGTGHNTLRDLIEMKVDVIKIDKYFIDRIDEKHTKSLIKHLIDLAHEMGMLVVSEGVETKEQLIILKQLGCDKIQGYYFSKPLLPDDFANYYTSFDISKYIG